MSYTGSVKSRTYPPSSFSVFFYFGKMYEITKTMKQASNQLKERGMGTLSV